MSWSVALQRAYNRWYSMINRCTDPSNKSWPDYGGRGITVCERWMNSFRDFYTDTGDAPEGLTFDRRDNDGPYSPENVRWATPKEQARNQRGARVLRTHCPQNHPYDAENTYTNRGKRHCRECMRASCRRRRQARAAQVSL